MKSKYQSQQNYHKEKMLQVKSAYNKEFVEQFRIALSILDLKQSDLIREMMNNTINQMKEEIQMKKIKDLNEITLKDLYLHWNEDEVVEKIHFESDDETIKSIIKLYKDDNEYVLFKSFIKENKEDFNQEDLDEEFLRYDEKPSLKEVYEEVLHYQNNTQNIKF